MRNTRLRLGALSVVLLAAACAPRRVATPPAPPAPKQNVIVLLPEPDGRASAIAVTNQVGRQDLLQAYQAVRVQRPDVAPGAPFSMDPAEVRRLFGAAIDALPAAELVFVLHFDEGRDDLNSESQSQLPAILNAIRQRRSTAITVTGHTDTTADPQFNYQLGLRRARRVAALLEAQGVNSSDLTVSSHGEADLLVPTAHGIAEARNRRVEVIVR